MHLQVGMSARALTFSSRFFSVQLHAHPSRTVVNQRPAVAQLPNLCEKFDLGSRDEIYRFSLERPKDFWGTLASERLVWRKEFTQVFSADAEEAKFRWFGDGTLNITETCLDRHAEMNPSRVALILERDEPGKHELVTYQQLLAKVCRFANLLRSYGVRKGDVVTLYLPTGPLVVTAMLAAARIGAVHNVVFAGFSADALAARINDAKSRLIVTSHGARRGGKVLPLKTVVDEAVQRCPQVEHVFVATLDGKDSPLKCEMGPKDVEFEKELNKQPKTCEPEEMNAEDPLFLLYTSGSTGKPKGLLHTQAGYLLYAGLTHSLVFDYRPWDVFCCVADVGWITGHTYGVYGPLANGGTSVLFESTPLHPNPGRYWEMVERLHVNQFYAAPTAIRLLLKYGDSWPKRYDLHTLRTIASVGEPINHEAWDWYFKRIGQSRCTLVDTWWQSETGGVCIAPTPADPQAPLIPSMAMRPFYGMKPLLRDELGNEIPPNTDAYGSLNFTQAWPGMARTIWNDHERYKSTYFGGPAGVMEFVTGDGCHSTKDGWFAITGRIDDVMNVSGHRLGTAEIEDALDEHDAVAESAVVPHPHPVKGQGIYAFVTLKEEVTEPIPDVIQDLKDQVKSTIAGYAVPDRILVVPSLPKTRSGKIMRRILRKIAEGGDTSNLGDVSTLADPTVVDHIIKVAAQPP